MNNLIKENNTVSSLTNKQPNTNYTIDKETGVAYISQREIARLLNINHKTVQNWTKKIQKVASLNLNKFNQLDEQSFYKLLIYGKRSRHSKEAENLLDKIALAGVRVFLYGMAKKEQQKVVSIEDKIKKIELDNQQLKSDNEELKKELSEMKTFLLTHQQEKINPHEIHDQYLEWTNKGWLKCYKSNVIKYNYELTDVGLEHLVQIKNKFRSKEDYE